MSASRVVGINPAIAEKLDLFWEGLSPERRAALHIAFNFSTKCPGRKVIDNVSECLINAESGRKSIANVRGDFFWFMAAHIEECTDDESMMTAILKWGELPDWQAQEMQRCRKTLQQ